MPALAIFTDFDGTLVEIAETPDAIEVPDELPGELDHLARCFDGAVAIISGRSLADLDRYLPPSVAAAGSHGAERRGPDGTLIAGGANEAAERLASALEPLLKRHSQLIVETKAGAVALHYRQAPHLAATCAAALATLTTNDDAFEVIVGKMVVEARRKGSGKGAALRAFMQEPPFKGRVPVFFGDDTTDEDGFLAAREMGGVGVKVGSGDTAATVRAADVAAARAVMAGLARRALDASERSG